MTLSDALDRGYRGWVFGDPLHKIDLGALETIVAAAIEHERFCADRIHYYRVRMDSNHPKRWVRRAWYGRTWQAEWDGCYWCPRAYTRAGIERKALRWQRRGRPWWLDYRRRWRRLVRRGSL
jgi:hypothetical protein